MLSRMPTAHADGVLASELDGFAIPQPKFVWSCLKRADARNTRHRWGHSSGSSAFSCTMSRERVTKHGIGV